jgi:hypothetical protein
MAGLPRPTAWAGIFRAFGPGACWRMVVRRKLNVRFLCGGLVGEVASGFGSSKQHLL